MAHPPRSVAEKVKTMGKIVKRKVFLFSLLFILLFLSFLFSFMLGGSRLASGEVFHALFHPRAAGMSQTIVWQVRFPRILLSLLIGAGLAACGCVFQGMLRNPLADPYTLGISGGAALGATLGIVFGLGNSLGEFSLPGCAFFGAFLCISLVYLVAQRRRFSVPTLILGGVILSFVFSACVMLIFAVSEAQDVHRTVLWLMGDLSWAPASLIKVVAYFIIGGIGLLLLFSRDLNLLTLGEEKAAHLGLETELVKKLLFIITSLITGACVAASGIIGFVGLIVPHFMRRFTGPDHQILIPASILGGAIFLSLCDTLARTIIAPLELPVGVITGILGGLFFLIFLFRSKRWEIF